MARIPDVELAEALREAGFSSTEIPKMVAIGLAESGGDPNAIGDGGTSFGIWQIHKPAHPELFQGGSDWTNPKRNAQMARSVYMKQGFNAWTMYKNAFYLMFMPRANAAAKLDASGSVLEKNQLPDPSGAISDVKDSAEAIVSGFNKAGAWITNPANIIRVIYVIAGVALVIGGLTVLAKPIIDPAVKIATKGVLK